MRLVEVGQRAVFGGDRAQLAQGPEVAVHRVDRLECDDARHHRRQRLEQLAQVLHVVVPEDRALCSRRADAVDHRGVVALVREDHAALEQTAEHAQRGVVGDEARREHERGFLAVQVGELVLELAHEQVRAGDVARPARADTVLGERLARRLHDRRVLAHAEVVVGAPVDHHARAAVGEPHVRGARGRSLELDEAPVAALFAQRVEPLVKTAQRSRDGRVPGARRGHWRRNTHAIKIRKSKQKAILSVRNANARYLTAATSRCGRAGRSFQTRQAERCHTGLNREADQGVSLARFSRPGARLPSDTRRRSREQLRARESEQRRRPRSATRGPDRRRDRRQLRHRARDGPARARAREPT